MRRESMFLILIGLLLALISPAVTAAASGTGAVFTLSNRHATNEVLVWMRAANGDLVAAGSVATGGTGAGAGLGSQGALTLSSNHHWLYAVNAGSDDVSVFRVDGTQLTLKDVEPSGGNKPISVTSLGDIVYVLNAWGGGSIQGFRRDSAGMLTQIAGSNQPLSQTGTQPAQIGFAPDGEHLVVTEKATNRITFYSVGADGAAGPPQWRDSSGTTPFGFEFAGNGTLVVSEAFGEAPDASATSTYKFRQNGTLKILDGSVASSETSACWVAITRSGRYVYVTNHVSGTVTGYTLSETGDLALLDADGVTASTGPGSGPIDPALDASSKHLYVLQDGDHAIAIFDRLADGSLVDRGEITSLPAPAVGLAAY